jgi:predicted nuclease of restriction endonuclease-like RecB superfamily
LKNKFEKKIHDQLKKAKVNFKYEGTKIPYVLSGHYIPDFVIKTKTGVVYVETKGYLRPEHKRKMAAVKRQHPELDIRILFYSKNVGYIRWANKHGFKYAIETIPEDWLEGF